MHTLVAPKKLHFSSEKDIESVSHDLTNIFNTFVTDIMNDALAYHRENNSTESNVNFVSKQSYVRDGKLGCVLEVSEHLTVWQFIKWLWAGKPKRITIVDALTLN